MKTFSKQTRTENIEILKTTDFDLVIIGGGIVGAGIARDAASRGMKVALVEKNDFASGTSSRSSKLIHGGIRYLENMEFGLVFEALNEREKLYELAPHLVHPLRFLLPIYKNSRVGYGLMNLGMWLYDVLALFQSELHESLNSKETMSRIPWLQNEGLVGSFVYSDAYMDDDRLTIETLRSAHSMGAVIVNYVEATKAISNSKGIIEGVIAEDRYGIEASFSIRGKHTVSCVGPWTDLVAPYFEKNWKKSLRPTKGIHITIAKERLPLVEAVVMAVDKENRIVFGIPRHEMVIVGTTDTDFKTNPDEVSATIEDVDYLLKIANEYFPKANLTRNDIIATYAGVRPLVDDGASTEGKTSREHKILTTDHGVSFVMGGKYTTYRKISEQAMSKIIKHFSLNDRVAFARGQTERPLNPECSPENYRRALTNCDQWTRKYHLSAEDTLDLAARHGMEAEMLLECGRLEGLTKIELELLHAIRHTMCLHLVDFYCRRSPLFLADPNHGLQWLEVLGTLAQNELGWSDLEKTTQMKNVETYIDKELAWQKNKH